jgi:transposase
MRPTGKPELLEQRRKKAIQLLQNGLRPVDVAFKLDVDRRSIRRWNAVYHRHGGEGLKARPNKGRPSRMNHQEILQLETYLLDGAQAAGFSTDLWTCPRIRLLIKNKFGILYHVDHLCRLLRRMGWSPQKPESRAIERDEDRIRTWKRIQWPRIKKKPKN